MFSWIVAITLGVAFWLFTKAIRPVVRRMLSAREARLNDRLSEFGGTHASDLALGPASKEGVAREYERKCVLEPARWAGDPGIPALLKRYRAIVSGREADPEGLNVPSAEILGRPNPDYERYLRNQRRVVGGDGLKAAGAMARKAIREQEIRDGFDEALRKMGMPEALIPAAITDERLESYSEADWRAVVKACRRVSEKYGESLAADMLATFTEAAVLCSEEAADVFDALSQQDVPHAVSAEVVRGNLTVAQAAEAVDLVEKWGYKWDDAVKEVAAKGAAKACDEALRSVYAHKVNPRAATRG